MTNSLGVGRLPWRRYWSDKITRIVVAGGGAAVIAAITLIFAYLLWVVGPMFVPGSMEPGQQVAVVERETLKVDVSENGEVFKRISADGIIEFYQSTDGAPVAAFSLGFELRDAQRVYPEVDLYALQDLDNQLWFVRTQYIVNFVDGERKLTPRIDFPLGKTPLQLPATEHYEAHLSNGQLMVASTQGTQVNLSYYRNAEMGTPLRNPRQVQLNAQTPVDHLFLGPRNEWLYLINASGAIEVLDIKPLNRITRIYQGQLAAPDETLTAVDALLGRYSLVTSNDTGLVQQWSIFNDTTGTRLEPIRSFQLPQSVREFVGEPRRKGFAALDENGLLTLLYPTSGRAIADLQTSLTANTPIAIAPRSDLLINAPDNGSLRTVELHNEHPEISFGTLWRKVWYEGYKEPIYSWQSSSADNDFEPKFSLTPLAFGTLKAAFYALLFAVPIAIMGAVYTAYFMAPKMRNWVKPGIEIMAALPTVILGFIGGLWLAPIIEANLSSVLGIFVVLPVGLFIFAIGWAQLPERVVKRLAGWYGLIVIPLIIATVYMAFDVGPFLELHLFGGDSREWFREVMGLNYDQRNALVVGIIMGLAVIPTIFSIAEDAIYGVPQHLTNGSLALGATPWQTLVRVVLLTASPGIFSAVMIGMGRAVGETMIVLMATGNTPLMDFNIFEGMRTFAANIAVELPESEVDSSHYRILFFAALVLFILTFIFNTLAEVVRQRLRARYGSL
ncbi:MAG: ABC transporter permease subunit [Pseudomonadota bacterium]